MVKMTMVKMTMVKMTMVKMTMVKTTMVKMRMVKMTMVKMMIVKMITIVILIVIMPVILIEYNDNEDDYCHFSVCIQVLLYQNEEMEDDDETMADYDIQDGSTIMLHPKVLCSV